MPINAHITCGDTGTSACVDNADNKERAGLVVATRPLKTFGNITKFFANPDYGVDMNINAAFGGTPDQVHNGTDTALWTGSQVAGGSDVIFNSTNRAYTGTRSVYINRVETGDTWQFAKGSDIDLNNYSAVTMRINVDNQWAANDNHVFYAWDSGTGAMVGNAVNLEEYMAYNEFDVWHALNIPLEDMGLTTATTVDAFRMRCDAISGQKPRYYIDVIQVEETAAAAEYTIEPDTGTYLYVSHLALSMATAYTGIVAHANNETPTFPALPYDSFLGQTLTTGLFYQRWQANELVFGVTIKSFMDLMQFPGVTVTGAGSDGTNSWATVNIPFVTPFILKPESADKLSFSLSEDLSSFLHLRVTAGCMVETRG